MTWNRRLNNSPCIEGIVLYRSLCMFLERRCIVSKFTGQCSYANKNLCAGKRIAQCWIKLLFLCLYIQPSKKCRHCLYLKQNLWYFKISCVKSKWFDFSQCYAYKIVHGKMHWFFKNCVVISLGWNLFSGTPCQRNIVDILEKKCCIVNFNKIKIRHQQGMSTFHWSITSKYWWNKMKFYIWIEAIYSCQSHFTLCKRLYYFTKLPRKMKAAQCFVFILHLEFVFKVYFDIHFKQHLKWCV